MTRQSVWQVYNGQIAELRKQGNTLQQIGNRVGVTRERIRQILKEQYGKIEIPLLPEYKAAELIGCSYWRLRCLRKSSVINPIHMGHYWRYSLDDMEAAMLAVLRFCKHCGEPLPLESPLSVYCPKCSKEMVRYNYPFRSDEGKKRYREAVRRWQQQHPERVRELARKASLKYSRKKSKEHFAVTQYLIVKGNILPIGSVVKAVGCKNSYLILEDGLTIPINYVGKVK